MKIYHLIFVAVLCVQTKQAFTQISALRPALGDDCNGVFFNAHLEALKADTTLSTLRLNRLQTTLPIYRKYSGVAQLKHGSVIEGSIEHGGLQPHYIVNIERPEIMSILKQAESLRSAKPDFWDLVWSLSQLVEQSMPKKAFDDPTYRALMTQVRNEQRNVEVNEYLKQRCGVCREHSIVLNLALQAAGIKASYQYVTALDSQWYGDHAVNLVEHGGQVWVVDSHRPYMTGARFADFLKKGGNTAKDPRAPLPIKPEEYGVQMEILQHPNIWVPN